jgi:hypothetical protein
MSKKVLAICYSQSGQLREIVDNFCEPLIEAGISVEKVTVTLAQEQKLPWTGERFFSVMPDCVQGVQAALNPFQLREKSYDLIVIGWQAWFLSPSIPFNSFVHDPAFQQVLKNTPVVTVTGARNMWVNAYGSVKKILKQSGAKQVGNIALVDRHLNLVSFITIFHWMLHNKKDKYLGIFPKPGVSEEDITHMKAFGNIAVSYVQRSDWSGMQEDMMKEGAVDLKFHLMFIEGKAGIMFKLWANLISKKKNKGPWLAAYKYYLFTALFVLAPVVYVIDRVFFNIFLSKHIRKQKELILNLS